MATELRFILLGLGALFLIGLALWELRRPRHAARKSGQPEPVDPAAWHGTPAFSADDTRPIDVPDIRGVDLRRDPPIVMIDAVTTVDADDGDEGLQVMTEVAVDRPAAAHAYADESAAEPELTSHDAIAEAEAVDEVDAPEAVTPPPVQPPAPVPAPPPAFEVRTAAIQWPPERQDRILWFRVVAPDSGRFGGRALRQALNGCGLVHGPQDIFHWADDSGRVIASAANLLRPGSFDVRTMDSQDFPGLHLFSVLPGPLETLHTFDELLSLARDLATRLNGLVQDERGQVVDASSIDAQRRALAGDEADA